MSESTAVGWSGRSRGGYFGNWFFIQLIRVLGLRWAYAWLLPVAAYFTLTTPDAFRASVEFLSRVRGRQPFWKRPLLVYRHLLNHGISLLDRVAVILGCQQIDCRFEGEEGFRSVLDRGQGVILVGAHLGNWEVGSHLLGRLGKVVNVVVLEREEARMRQLFEQALQARRFRLLTTDAHPLRSIPILAALRRGEIVALHGDRSFGGNDLAVPFLGGSARFPIGPFLLAAAGGAPLFQVFVVRERLGHYRFVSSPAILVPRALLRADREALRPYLADYARRLEEVARNYPFQWANFYPYWDPPAPGATPGEPSPTAAPPRHG